MQIKMSDYMRQYVWDTELSATEIALWKQLMFLQYNVVSCYFQKHVHKMIKHHLKLNIFHILFTI